jgi:D-tyrosyl-tRNA(Tyr) deacylase
VRALLQRVRNASVTIGDTTVGSIGGGLVVLLGVTHDDGDREVTVLAGKILNLRIFPDDAGKMNRSILDTHGSVLLVSQFTLYGDTRKGRRPGFDNAAKPEHANALYRSMVHNLGRYIPVETGEFGAHMVVTIVNDGPVTFFLDTADM